jgi:hypothetical protein
VCKSFFFILRIPDSVKFLYQERKKWKKNDRRECERENEKRNVKVKDMRWWHPFRKKNERASERKKNQLLTLENVVLENKKLSVTLSLSFS